MRCFFIDLSADDKAALISMPVMALFIVCIVPPEQVNLSEKSGGASLRTMVSVAGLAPRKNANQSLIETQEGKKYFLLLCFCAEVARNKKGGNKNAT